MTPEELTLSFRRYGVRYTEVKPGGSHARQDAVCRSLEEVRALLDSRRVYAGDPIEVVEYLASDSTGRVVPASEWDIVTEEASS
jgi:hypothetical protein